MTAVAGCKLRPGPCMNWSEPTKRLLFGPQQARFDPKVVKYSRAKAIRNGSAPMHFFSPCVESEMGDVRHVLA